MKGSARVRAWAALGKRLRWFGATFLALEALYLIAGNLFLNFVLGRLASSSPETVEMQIEGAFTLWPTAAHVRRYHLRSQTMVCEPILGGDELRRRSPCHVLSGGTTTRSTSTARGSGPRRRREAPTP